MKLHTSLANTVGRRRSIRKGGAVKPVGRVDPSLAGESSIERLPLPSAGSLVRLDSETHRVVAHVGRRLLLSHVATSAIYLVQEGARGDLRLPSRKVWFGLVEAGRAEAVQPTAQGAESSGSDGSKISLECDMLDAARVPLGTKAMEIWLHANWTADLVARWGPHDSAHTLRFWRRERRRQGAR